MIHRYWDTSPFSPSGRYLALTRLPAEDRLPEPGDVAEVVLVDLQAGGERVLMLLRIDGRQMRFVTARWDGADYRALHDGLIGSGHPSMHPDGRHILTDCNANDANFCHEDGSCPIRLVDVRTGEDLHLVRIGHAPEFIGPQAELRVDPHPAWDRGFTRIAFNACPDGTRRVYVADLAGPVGDAGTDARAGTAQR